MLQLRNYTNSHFWFWLYFCFFCWNFFDWIKQWCHQMCVYQYTRRFFSRRKPKFLYNFNYKSLRCYTTTKCNSYHNHWQWWQVLRGGLNYITGKLDQIVPFNTTGHTDIIIIIIIIVTPAILNSTLQLGISVKFWLCKGL